MRCYSNNELPILMRFSMTPTSPPPPLRIDDLLGNRVILEAGQEAIVGRSGTFPVGTDDVFLHRSLFQV